MNPDDEIAVTRDGHHSSYAWYPTTVNDLQEFVSALYSVGAVGDEHVSFDRSDSRIKVNIASDDLMPKPGEGPVLVRHDEYTSMRSTITWLRTAVVLLAASALVFLICWLIALGS